MTQLNMIIRYMGGTPPPLVHIEIEESGGQIHATAQFGGGLNFTGDAVMINQRLPETIRTALVGRPLSALIDHPLLPGDEKIIAIREMGIGNFFNRRYRTQNRMTRYQWKN